MSTNGIRSGEKRRDRLLQNVLLLYHTIDWQSANVLDYTRNFRQRKISEALHIRKHTGDLMNKDQGWAISKAWNASWQGQYPYVVISWLL